MFRLGSGLLCLAQEQRPGSCPGVQLRTAARPQLLRPTSPAAWLVVRSQLQELGVKLISQQELLFAQEAGVPVIDIRPPAEWEAGHIDGSVNVPLYRLITGVRADSAGGMQPSTAVNE